MLHEIWECWVVIMKGVVELAFIVWPFFVGYLTLYVVTAAVFLLALRIKSEDGKLVVKKNSLAFFLAHPLSKYHGVNDYIYTGYSADGEKLMRYPDSGSICAFYMRLFNMLLFVWPFLLLYLLLGTIVLGLFGALFLGCVAWPDFQESGFFRVYPIKLPLIVVIAPVVLLVLGVWKFGALVRIISWVAMAIACLLPILAAIGTGTLITIKLRGTDENSSVLAAKEFVVAKKERFCSILEFK